MKTMMKYWTSVCCMIIAFYSQAAYAQKIDEERMERDIEVAENVLSTLIKQGINQQRGFFGVDIKGSYLPGYGVTFRLPGDFAAPFIMSIGGGPDNAMIYEQKENGYSYTITTEDNEEDEEMQEDSQDGPKLMKLKTRRGGNRRENMDSLRDDYNLKLVQAAKDFIVDYGDFISQLAPNEKIVITNQGEHNQGWFFNTGKRTHLSVEGLKSDIIAFKQGKITRDQAVAKLKIINTESVDTKSPDMELMSSIFGRLYRSDLSKTYFSDDNIYYEYLKDYGVIYYMQVYSGTESGYDRFNMPTLNLEDIDRETRNKKVVEIYPKFEQDIKENILEYGRTIKSLKDDELVVFNITLTKCKGCGIPSTLELSIKSNVLKDYGSSKIDKYAALAKFAIKKGAPQ
jgi:hypothetical protein